MTGGEPTRVFAEFAARLERRARALAEARARQVAAKRRGDARHWRRAALLWPLFGEG